MNIWKKYQSNFWFKTFLLVSVFVFTFILRAHNYDKIPEFKHLEEHAFGWAGIYLIETGSPVSWSSLEYPKSTKVRTGIINYHGNEPHVSVDLYKPWLDQPPLFSLITGYSAHLYGADRTQLLPPSFTRFPSIILAFLTSIFLFLIAKKLSGFYIGLFTVLLFGTIPVFVFASRFAVAESLITLIYLISCFLIFKFLDNRNIKFLIPIAILAGIAGLAKATGFLILPLALFFAFKYKFYKSFILMLLLIMPFMVGFFVYGYYFSPDIFWRINEIQSSRPIGFSNLAWFFVSPAFDIFPITDSWYIFCLLSTVFLTFQQWTNSKLTDKDNKRYLSFFIIYWLLVVMISGGEGDLLPWYRFPIFPLLALMGAWGIIFIFKNINFVTSVIGITFFLGSRHLIVNEFRPNFSPAQFRMIVGALLSPSLLNLIYNKIYLEKLSRIIVIMSLLIGMYFNVIYIYNYFELTCESKRCPFGPSTFLSRLYFPVAWRFFTLPPL